MKKVLNTTTLNHVCSTCDGNGVVFVPGGNVSPCPSCGGTGTLK